MADMTKPPTSEPGEAYLVLHDGERVPCLLEPVSPAVWRAVPVRCVDLAMVAEGYVDLLPAGAKVEFLIEGTDA